jgi:hypothetical protein
MAKKLKQPTTKAELRKLLVKWQKRLRLLDWDITINFDKEDGVLDEIGAWARCGVTAAIRDVEIVIKHPHHTLNPYYDLEMVLVHELLHIFWSGMRHKDFAGLMTEEQMVDTLSILLVDLERHGKKVGRATPFDTKAFAVDNRLCARYSVKKESYPEGDRCGN